MNIWDFQAQLINRLLAWSIFSVISGTIFALSRDLFLRGLGGQFLGWGLIDALIALVGRKSANKRLASLPDANKAAILEREGLHLKHFLAVNTSLDIFYMIGGLWLVRGKRHDSRIGAGTGWGIFVQGAFLFVFDLFHLLRLNR